jgi:hypothetical protein
LVIRFVRGGNNKVIDLSVKNVVPGAHKTLFVVKGGERKFLDAGEGEFYKNGAEPNWI